MDGSLDETGTGATPPPECIIVIPCYNEASRFHAEPFAEFLLRGLPIRFLFVNDGSSDGTLALLEALRDHSPGSVEVLNLLRNSGKAEAVRQGMLRAMQQGAAYVGFLDADLATPLGALPRLLQTLRERPKVAMVFGARVRLLGRSVQRDPMRHYLGRGFATAVSTMLRLPVYDTQCGAKLFRATPILAAILARPFQSRWIFDVEMIARYMSVPGKGRRAAECEIYELPLDAWHDIAGSKVGFSDFLRSAVDLIRIRRAYSAGIRSGKPERK
jgi:glycosyltransferase involved in cell wall biosynthesis